MRTSQLLFLAIALTACGPEKAPPVAAAAATAPAPTGNLPAPFSAAELKAGIPVGTEIKLRLTAAGEATLVQHWIFTAADDSGCTIHGIMLAEDGVTVLTDDGAGATTWAELETHAHFPAALTTRTDSTVEVEAGKFDTWRFEVRPAAPGEPSKVLHFARDLPGPPVLMEETVDGEVVLRMELVSRTQP